MSAGDVRRCCGAIDPGLERELLALLREGKPPLEVIKRLREATRAPLADCRQWVVEHAGSTATSHPRVGGDSSPATEATT
jgi:hypothetical protein